MYPGVMGSRGAIRLGGVIVTEPFARRLRREILAQYTSLGDFAKALDPQMERTQLTRYVREINPQRPEDETLRRFAHALHKPVKELFDWRALEWVGDDVALDGHLDGSDSAEEILFSEFMAWFRSQPRLVAHAEEVRETRGEPTYRKWLRNLFSAWGANLELNYNSLTLGAGEDVAT